MSSPVHNKSHSPNATFKGRQYREESEQYYQDRVNFAAAQRAAGCTHKQSWYKAFQQYPRVYLDEIDLSNQ